MEHTFEKLIKKTKYLVYGLYELAKVMPLELLTMIYYAFFNSIISYGIIGWGRAYLQCIAPLQALQRGVLKIMYKNKFPDQDRPLNMEKCYILEEALNYHYQNLKNQYTQSKSSTRNKSILLPKENVFIYLHPLLPQKSYNTR